MKAVQTIPRECISERITEQTVIIPVPQIGEEIVEVSQIIPEDASQLQFIDKVVDIPVVARRQIPIVPEIQETIESPQVQNINKIVDVPVVQVVQTVQKTVEVSQVQFL